MPRIPVVALRGRPGWNTGSRTRHVVRATCRTGLDVGTNAFCGVLRPDMTVTLL